MVYNAKTQRGILGFFLVITATSISIKDFSNGMLYFQIGLIVFILLSLFIQFKFKIDDGYLVYQILFLAMPIYKKEVSPNQIIRIKFKRLGWMTKGAIIQVKKGFNIRVVHFSPDNIFVDLIDFANENSISISKTKDYRILEK
ncbi:hypothetical protein [Neobacillus drentensis]|uniref:hypothetical protein n=1 Tax=Neobacillus drentensis TaxID=220684 RepID=UPI00082689BF|nr:hypothetical protein [Neobacillus drentensis]